METQKIINLLNDSTNEESKSATKKWYVIDSQTAKGKYSKQQIQPKQFYKIWDRKY